MGYADNIGFYGKYNEKGPSRPATMVGPTADASLRRAAKLALQQTPPATYAAEAGMANNPLAKTKKGYPHIGSSTPPTEPVMNIPFNNGAEAAVPRNALAATPQQRPNLVQPWPISPREHLARVDATPGEQQTAQQRQPFRSVLPSGITYEGDMQGNRTYTMGQPGQPGYGKMVVHPGTARESLAQSPGRQASRAQAPAYSFEGSAEDASRFFAPVSRPAPTAATLAGGDRGSGRLLYQEIRDRHEQAEGQDNGEPQYLGPESGIDWRTREKLYATQMDAHSKRLSDKNAMDIARMQEAGAGERTALTDSTARDRNMIELYGDRSRDQIARETLASQLPGTVLDTKSKQVALDSAKRLEDLQDKYIQSGDPAEQRSLARQILTLQGKDASKYQIVTRKGFDPKTAMPTETNYAVNNDDPTQSYEIGGGGDPTAGANVEMAPQDPAKRIAKREYTLPSGIRAIWDGKGWLPIGGPAPASH